MLHLAGTALLACAAPQQSPELIADLGNDPLASINPQSSFPGAPLAEIGGTIYFAAEGTNVGFELYRTDGTTAGTSLVADFIPGPVSSSPTELVELPNSQLLVLGKAGFDTTEQRLRVIDPASGAFFELLDNDTDPEVSSVANWAGSTWLLVRNSANQFELWTTDGTEGGTVFRETLVGAPASESANLTPSSQSLYVHGGNALWAKSNPTNASILITSDRSSGLDTLFGTNFLFNKEDSLGSEPWITDGTLSGTTLLGDLEPGPQGSEPKLLDSGGGLVWFSAWTTALGRELFRTDGSPAGTKVVTDLNPGASSGISESTPVNAAFHTGLLYFAGWRPTGTVALFRSDGTSANTVPVFVAGTEPTQNYAGLASFGSQLLYAARDSSNPIAELGLWTTDGTLVGTSQIEPSIRIGGLSKANVVADSLGSLLLLISARQNNLAAMGPDFGYEPWISRGATSNTQAIANLNLEPTELGSNPRAFARLNDKLFFSATTPLGSEPWVFDSSTKEVVSLGDLKAGTLSGFGNSSEPSPIGLLGDRLLFSAITDMRWPWITDGTPAGTLQLSDTLGLNPSIPPVSILNTFVEVPQGAAAEYIEWNGLGYFAGGVPSGGREIIVTDGTPAGTTQLTDFGPDGSSPHDLTLFQDRLYFLADPQPGSSALCSTDGTPQGTQVHFSYSLDPLTLFSNTPASLPRRMLALEDRLIFRANTPAFGVELWQSDGTGSGTTLVADLAPGVGFSAPEAMVRIGSRVVFLARPSQGGLRVFSTDGTQGGTFPLSGPDEKVLPAGGPQTLLTATTEYVYYAVQNSDRQSLMRTPATAADPVEVTANEDFFQLSFPRHGFVPASDGLFFSAQTVEGGADLWFTDSATTVAERVTDTLPGPLGSRVSHLERFGNQLVYSGLGPEGTELYSIPFSSTGAFDTRAYGSTACSQSGSFALGLSGLASVGALAVLEASGAAPSAPLIVYGSGQQAFAPLTPACQVSLAVHSLALFSLTSDASGESQIPIVITNPTFVGVPIYLQAVSLLPGGPLFDSLELSAGLEVVIGL